MQLLCQLNLAGTRAVLGVGCMGGRGNWVEGERARRWGGDGDGEVPLCAIMMSLSWRWGSASHLRVH